MHRNLHVALGGAALTLGALVALPGIALAQEVDCDDDQVAAIYPDVCVEQPGTPIGGGEGGGATETPPNGTPETETPPNGTPETETPPNGTPETETPAAGGGGGTATGGTTGGGGTATGGTTGGGGTASAGGGATSLPFTGDEILVLSLAGAGALAAGTALAAAGRRRSTPFA